MQLQLRSAISHLNEVWAIENGGVMLSAFADILPWEWIHNAARWTYDESRHCRMGYAVSGEGDLACLKAATGERVWGEGLKKDYEARPRSSETPSRRWWTATS